MISCSIKQPVIDLQTVESTIFQTSIWQIDVSFSRVCPVIDHEFRHYIVKVAVDPRGDSRVDPQTKFMINNRKDAWKTDVNLFSYNNKKVEGTKLSQNARRLSAYWQ